MNAQVKYSSIMSIFSVILFLIFVFTFTGCGGNGSNGAPLNQDPPDPTPTPDPEFSTIFDGSLNYDGGEDIVIDNEGYILITGYAYSDFHGQVNSGDSDGFVAKYDALGNRIWTRLFGSSANEKAYSIAIDDSNNIYVTGFTDGEFNEIPLKGGGDFFIIKFDKNGNEIWTIIDGVPGSSETALSIDVHGSIVYISGITDGDFATANFGETDIILAEYQASDGSQILRRQIGTSSHDLGYEIKVHEDDTAVYTYIAGSAYGPLGSGPAGGGSGDLVLLKYDASGTLLWARQRGSAVTDFGKCLDVDSQGSVYIGGFLGLGIDGFTVNGVLDGVVIKYDSNGNWQWTRLVGSDQSDQFEAINVDSEDNIYLTGGTFGNVGGNVNTGKADIMISRFNSSGNHIWTKTYGTVEDDFGYSAGFDSEGNVFITGNSEGNLDDIEPKGLSDFFVIKYDSSGSKF